MIWEGVERNQTSDDGGTHSDPMEGDSSSRELHPGGQETHQMFIMPCNSPILFPTPATSSHLQQVPRAG